MPAAKSFQAERADVTCMAFVTRDYDCCVAKLSKSGSINKSSQHTDASVFLFRVRLVGRILSLLYLSETSLDGLNFINFLKEYLCG